MAIRSWHFGAVVGAVLCATLSSQAAAATFSSFSGTLTATAFAGGVGTSPSIPVNASPPDNYGTYSVPDSATAPPNSGPAVGSGSTSQARAMLGSNSIFADISYQAEETVPGGAGASGSAVLDFSVANEVNVGLLTNFMGNYSESVQDVSTAQVLYNISGANNLSPVSTSALLDLQPGTYQLSVSGSFLPVEGTFPPESISVQVTPTPIPAAVWLFGSGLMALGGLFARKRATEAG